MFLQNVYKGKSKVLDHTFLHYGCILTNQKKKKKV